MSIKYGKISSIKLPASIISNSSFRVFPSFTVMTSFLQTFIIASKIVFVSIFRNCSNLSKFFRGCHRFRLYFKFSNYNINRQHHTSLDFHWISHFTDILEAHLGNRHCQNTNNDSAITSLFVCVIGKILDKLSQDIFVFII